MGFLVPYLLVAFSFPPSLQRYTFVITIIPPTLATTCKTSHKQHAAE
jgi:hypothetical protein